MTIVNKTDIARAVCDATGLPLVHSKSVIDAFLAAVKAQAEGGATVRLSGFGAFSVKARPARTGRNPRTGETMELPETRKLTFKASKVAAPE